MKFKKMLTLAIMIYFNTLKAGQLSCSANGLDVFYVNGVLNTDKDVSRSKDKIIAIIQDEKVSSRLISNTDPNVTEIFNESHLLLDLLEMSWQKTYIRTGVQFEYGVTAVANELDSKSVEDGLAILSEGGMLGDKSSDTINNTYLKTKQAMIEHAESRKQIMKAFLAKNKKKMESDSLKLAEKVASEVKTSLDKQNKIIFVAHSQGNPTVISGIKNISEHNPEYLDSITKYVGFYHLGSPIIPINRFSSNEFLNNMNTNFKTDSFLFASDWIIWALSVLDPFLEYPTDTPTHRVKSFLGGKHNFTNGYLSSDFKAYKISDQEQIERTPAEFFTDGMIGLAESLESNCGPIPIHPKIVENGKSRHDYTIYMSASELENGISLNFVNFIDANKDGITDNLKNFFDGKDFNWEISGEVNQSGSGFPIFIDEIPPSFTLKISSTNSFYTTSYSFVVYDSGFKMITEDSYSINGKIASMLAVFGRPSSRYYARDKLKVNYSGGILDENGKQYLFENYGIYNADMIYTDPVTNIPAYNSFTLYAEPPISFQLIPGTASHSVYSYTMTFPSYPYIYGCTYHSYSSGAILSGPVGTFLSAGVSVYYPHSVTCGDWTMVDSEETGAGCLREKGQAAVTNANASAKIICAGIGCSTQSLFGSSLSVTPVVSNGGVMELEEMQECNPP